MGFGMRIQGPKGREFYKGTGSWKEKLLPILRWNKVEGMIEVMSKSKVDENRWEMIYRLVEFASKTQVGDGRWEINQTIEKKAKHKVSENGRLLTG
jgi:uncharacterized radical SAM superfamily Fe-S cluster-containing enzyme